MTADVLLRKLTYIRQLLADLSPYAAATQAQVQAEHYKLERLLELLVTAASDLLFHLLAEQGVAAPSYREAFRLAGQLGLLPVDLAERLQLAAGMRNVLVHMYDEIDLHLLAASIEPALVDFSRLIVALEPRIQD